MRRKSRNNHLQIFTYSAVLVIFIAGFGYASFQSFGQKAPDHYGCYNDVRQLQTLVLFDASEPRFNEEQARSIRRYLDQTYNSLSFNEKFSVYTSEKDVMGSVMKARFHVCGQASGPEQLERVNAGAAQAGYLEKQRERLYEKILSPELDALLSATPDESRKQLFQSPILEMVSDLSRSTTLKEGGRLIIVSDLVQNSDSVKFCSVKNNMPSFTDFKQRRIYQRIKPRSLEGFDVEILMLQRQGYGLGDLRYCKNEEEIRQFWQDYLKANGVDNLNFIRIRQGMHSG